MQKDNVGTCFVNALSEVDEILRKLGLEEIAEPVSLENTVADIVSEMEGA
jgi:hypothetical protein